jgi:hypothetical protein
MKTIARCLVVLAASILLGAAANAQNLIDLRRSIGLTEDATHFSSGLNLRTEFQTAREQRLRCNGCEFQTGKLGTSIALTARAGIVEQGVATAKEAIQSCQKGDYPGGGLGLLSLPSGRESARTAHCQR